MEYQKITSYNLYRIKEDIDLTENKFISDTRHAVYIDHYPIVRTIRVDRSCHLFSSKRLEVVHGYPEKQ